MFKVEKPQADFTIVCNAVLRDARLSLRTKGLYALMFSKPEDWIFHEAALMKESTEGRDAVRGAFKELLDTNWLSKLRRAKAENSSTTSTGSPLTRKPSTANPLLLILM